MKLFLLDGGGVLLPAFGLILFFMFVIILLEAFIMNLFKLNTFAKCFTDSLIVNIVSLLSGFVVRGISGFDKLGSTVAALIILFLVTVAVEGLLLMLLNSKLSRKKIWVATVVMNIASYIVLMIFARGAFDLS